MSPRHDPMSATTMAEFIRCHLQQIDRWQGGTPSKFTSVTVNGKLSHFEMQVTRRRKYIITVQAEGVK